MSCKLFLATAFTLLSLTHSSGIGRADKTVSFENVERFDRLMRKAGNVCKLLAFEGPQHGFFNVPGFKKGTKEDFTAIMEGATAFLTEEGLAPESTETDEGQDNSTRN